VVNGESLGRYLAKIGWPGEIQVVEEWLRALGGKPVRRKFQIVVEHELTSKIELEFHFDYRRKLDGNLTEFLRGLVQLGICRTERAEPLADWPGWHYQHELGMRVDRWLDLKLVLEAKRQVEGKAYLGFMPSEAKWYQ
jgi:hypothetical protein